MDPETVVIKQSNKKDCERAAWAIWGAVHHDCQSKALFGSPLLIRGPAGAGLLASLLANVAIA